MATKEAEVLINKAKDKANAESSKITKDGEDKLAKTKSQIDANFDDAVNYIVSTALKA